MGIRGVWTRLRNMFTHIDPLRLEPTDIGIDMFSLVYTHRTKLKELLELLTSWSKAGHRLTCIWDGVAPKDKEEIIETRRSAREVALDKKTELVEYLRQFEKELTKEDIQNLKSAISSLSWQGWRLTGSMRQEIQNTLGSTVKHIYAPSEADDLLISMAHDGTIKIIMTLDSDLFALGGEHIWRLLYIRDEWIVEDIRVEKVCDSLGISLPMLQDACFLAGWDRCHLTDTGYMTFDSALNRIKHYGSMEPILEKFQISKELAALSRLKQIKKESKDRWVQILNKRIDQ